MGGVLAAPSSNQENEFIAQLVPDYWIWIDCNDLEVEGIWKCRDDSVEVAYRNWHDGEPNNAIEEDCAAVAACATWGNNQWFDRSCIISERALCKVAGRPVLHV